MIYSRRYKKKEIPVAEEIPVEEIPVAEEIPVEEEKINTDKNGIEYTTKKHNHKKGKK